MWGSVISLALGIFITVPIICTIVTLAAKGDFEHAQEIGRLALFLLLPLLFGIGLLAFGWYGLAGEPDGRRRALETTVICLLLIGLGFAACDNIRWVN